MRLGRSIAGGLVCLSFLPLASCSSVASRGIYSGRTAINNAIQDTDGEQLLLNIVRQRYNDPVMFLDVTSVSDSFSRSSSFNLSSLLSSQLHPETYAPSIGGGASGSPLIFYSPNTGERFVRQILSPLDLRTISLMLQSGWSVERVLLVVGDSINGIRNTAAKDTDFAAIAADLRSLQRSNLLSFAFENNAAGEALTIIFDADAVAHPSYLALCRNLELQPDGARVQIRIGVGDAASRSAGTIFLATRSLHSAFYFLSNAVAAPQSDMDQRTIPARSVAGGLFDPASSSLFRISTSQSEPRLAAVKVHYRDDWFYIPETDAESRTTFSLISMMLMLQTGDSARMSPLISLSPR